MTDYVISQDDSSGRAHKRILDGSGYLTHEADNLDQAGSWHEISEAEFADLPHDAKCQRCWPEPEA